MPPRRDPLRGACCLVLAVAAVTLTGCAAGRTSATPAAPPAVTRFLATYVTADGRVIRHDQGSDIVSEGQAYAMVLAEAAHRPSVARTVWAWTDRHLRRPDGLLSYHASAGGRVLDAQAASDADTLLAFALLRYRGAGSGSLHAEGRRLAAAVMAHDTVQLPDGRLLLAAGPWATGSPASLNPSYWMPSIFRAIGATTGDHRWSQLATDSISALREITRDGAVLPSDWARADGARLTAEPAPGGNQSQPTYGYDAVRVPLWLARSHDSGTRQLESRWWALLRQGHRAQSGGLGTDGSTVDPTLSPAAMAGAAAAARASGATAAARSLLNRAVQQTVHHPTYYGDAVVALATAAADGGLATG